MAQRVTKAMLNRVFSSNEISQFAELGTKINTAQKQADGLARTIAGALYAIQVKKLYEIESYKNIYEYAEQTHGISRGTCSDAINVFKRFGDKDNKTELLPEWQAYAFRALIMMKNVTDDTLARLEITPILTSKEIKQRIRDYTDFAEMLPNDWTLEVLHNTINAQTAIEDKQEVTSETSSTTEDNAATEAPETPVAHTVEPKRTDEERVKMRDRAREIMGEEEFAKFEKEEADNLDEAVEDYLEEFTMFPKRTIYLNNMSDAEAIKCIKALIADIRNGEYDLIVTMQ